MSTNIKIRDVAHEDWDVWQQLWTAYFDFYKMSRSSEVYQTTFERLLGHEARDFNGLLAEVNGRPVGLTHYAFYRHAHYIEEVCYLQDLYIDPKVRGLGVGRALIEAVSQRAKAHKCAYVYWLTHEGNHQARRLYDSLAKVEDFVRYVHPLG